MNRQQRPITDRELKAWLAAGPVDRGVGEGLTFVASTTAARSGKASWILRFRLNGRFKEKVLGRYPELSLKDAREHARQNRVQIERGIDVAAAKQTEKALLLEVPTVQRLGEVWFAKYIQPRYKHPEVVARVLRKHINPVLGPVAPPDVQPVHIDRVLTRIVASGAPTRVDRFVAERSLNHKLGNVEGIYDRHDYFAERATALGAWAALLGKIEGGSGPIKIQAEGRSATAKFSACASPLLIPTGPATRASTG